MKLYCTFLLALLLGFTPQVVRIPGPGGSPATSSGIVFETASPTPGTGTFNSSITTGITLGGTSSTRAVMIGLSFNITSITGIAVDVGGNTATLVSGTDTTTSSSNARTMIYCVHTALTGAQTVTASWTGDSGVGISAISATGTNVSTPCGNGTDFTQDSPATSFGVTVTSSAGQLTSSFIASNVTPTTNRTLETTSSSWSGVINQQDIGPGTGTTTHTWSLGGGISWVALSGANFQ